MRDSIRVGLVVVVLLALVSSAPVAVKNKKKGDEAGEATPGHAPSRWLVLGPVIDPLPAFHDAKRGGYDIKARLEAEVFPDHGWTPRAGAPGGWPGPDVSWREVEAVGGSVSPELPDGVTEARPAAVWLATRIEVERFRKLTIEVLGEGPRRAWVDGRRVASGGADEAESGGKVSAEVELTRGKHLLLVESLHRGGERAWSAGAVLRPADDLGLGGLSTTLDEQRALTILDVLDPPRITSTGISADGSFVVAGLERYYPGTDRRETWIEVYARSLYRTIRAGGDVGQVDWAPRGERLSYVTTAKDDEGKSRSTIWVLDLQSNRVDPVLEAVPDFVDYRWSPDGGKIVYRTRVEPAKDERGFKRLEGLMDRWAGYRTKEYLHLVTVPGGMRRRLTAGPLATSAPSFSPDGRRMLFTRTVEDVDRRPYARTEVWEMDLETFESRRLRDFVWLTDASYAPDGRRILVHGGPDTFGETGVNVPEGRIPNSYDGQLFLWDPSSDEVRAITRDFDPAVKSAVWNRATGKIVLTAEDGDHVRLYAYDPAGERFEQLDTGFDVFTELSSSLSSPGVVGLGTSPWQSQALVGVDVSRNVRTTLSLPAKEDLRHVRRGQVEAWSFESSGGRTIQGRFYLPPDFDPGVRYPLIVHYYGGTSPIARNFGGRYPMEYWASQGYVVYNPQPSGATGFGQEFSSLHVNDWGRTTADEVIEGTRKFVEAHPYVDPARVGCIGASYGGFLTMLLTTQTDLFAAAVAHAGISSISSYWGEGYWGWGYSAVASADSFPWNRPEIYVEQSPLFRADRNAVPILLTHGTDDTNVPVGESDQFYVALKLLGRPVEYLQVEGQNHWILDHDKRVVWSRSIVAWFDRWLKGQPQWWDALWPERD